MIDDVRLLTPVSGWSGFRDSDQVLHLLWDRLRTWHYSNHGGGAIWEDERTGGGVYVAFEGDAIVELVIRPCASEIDGLIAELASRFGLEDRRLGAA